MKLNNILTKLRNPEIRKTLDSRYGLGRLEKLFFSNWFNPVLTIWINFRSLPIRQAFRFPLWVYGRPRFYCLSGKIRFRCKDVKSGMIKINFIKYGAPGNMSRQTEIYNLGTIEFGGPCEIGTGNKIIVASKTLLSIGSKCLISDNCTIAAYRGITIGDITRITHSCQILDTSFHYIADLNKKIAYDNSAKLNIGKACWIGNSSAVVKGANLPDYAIIGSHSLVNKDFSSIENGCIIAGIPAKLIKNDVVRIFNLNIENLIWHYMAEHPGGSYSIQEYDVGELTKRD